MFELYVSILVFFIWNDSFNALVWIMNDVLIDIDIGGELVHMLWM